MKTNILILLGFCFCFSCAKEDFVPEEQISDQGNTLVLAENTMVVDKEDMSDILMISETEVSFTKSSDYSKQLEVGDFLIGHPTEEFPYGILRKINLISETDGEVKYTTSKGSIYEAFESFDFSIKIDDFQRDLRYCESIDELPGLLEDISSINVPFDFENAEICIESNMILEKTSEPKYRIGYDKFEINLNGNLVMRKAVNYSDGPNAVIDQNLQPIVFTIGPVPVTIIPNITLEFGYNVDLAGDINIEFNRSMKSDGHVLEFDPATENFDFVVNSNESGSGSNSTDVDAVFTGSAKIILNPIISLSAYDEDIASASFNNKLEVEPVIEATAFTDCLLGAKVDLFLDNKIDGSIKLVGFDEVRKTFSRKRISWEILKYCSSCVFSIDEVNQSLSCFDSGTPDDFTDDQIVYNSVFNISHKGTGENENENRTGFRILVDNTFYPSNTDPFIFEYGQEVELLLSNESHELQLEDVQEDDCAQFTNTYFHCESGVLEEEGDPPASLCNDRILDSRDGEIYCWLDVDHDGKTTRWLRRNLRYADDNTSNIGFYVNDNSANWRKGKLYTWDEVSGGNICPSGYRVASVMDWEHLLSAVRAKNNLAGDSFVAPYLKGTTYWNQSGKGNGEGLYSQFFELLPNGYYTTYEDEFLESNKSSNIWTTDPYVDFDGNVSEHSVYSVNIVEDDDQVFLLPVVKEAFALGCRCVMDQ